jgi:hypothetical protein
MRIVVRKMLGVADIAAIFGVEPKTVSMWRLRYRDFPEPDAVIGDVAGWDPDRAEEVRVWASRRPGRGRRAAPAEHVQEALRRILVYRFMRPDDFAWAPIQFPGIEYDQDGRLTHGMQAKGAAYLVDAMRSQGLEIAFEDPATDATDAMQRVLWEKWTEEEVGEHQFIGRLFDERGQIYHGCTAFDAARYCLQRLAALGGELRSVHER